MDSPATLTDKVVCLHRALAAAGLAHAFGGALALAWCTGNGRGTIDIDINVFVTTHRAEELRAALPASVTCDDANVDRLVREGQVRLDWRGTPLDIFLDTTEIHEQAAKCVSWEHFAGHRLPFLSCFHVALFKAFFNRTKDWADLEAMRDAGTLDVERGEGCLGSLPWRRRRTTCVSDRPGVCIATRSSAVIPCVPFCPSCVAPLPQLRTPATPSWP